MKYKNKDGISLNYTNDNDIHQSLVKEVIGEAIKMLEQNNSQLTIKFLKTNFDIEEERSDEWRINQFNRNRSIEDQVHSIQEMSDAVEDMGKE